MKDNPLQPSFLDVAVAMKRRESITIYDSNSKEHRGFVNMIEVESGGQPANSFNIRMTGPVTFHCYLK